MTPPHVYSSSRASGKKPLFNRSVVLGILIGVLVYRSIQNPSGDIGQKKSHVNTVVAFEVVDNVSHQQQVKDHDRNPMNEIPVEQRDWNHSTISNVGTEPSWTTKGIPTNTTIMPNTTTHQYPYTVREGNLSSGPRFAYAYAVAGCDEASCIGYVLNSIVAATILRHYNSTSDVVLLVRMGTKSKLKKLPAAQEEWLDKANVKLYYVPKLKFDSFATATLEKFRVLDLVEYERVRFFDADLIPLCSLDREFEDSVKGRLQGFVGKRGGASPITASDFIVTPQKGLFARTMNLIHQRRNVTTQWDPQVGWGHKFGPGERWIAGNRQGSSWDFFGASIDQGLLYQLFRFELGTWSDTSNGHHIRWQEISRNDFSPNITDSSELVALSNGNYAAELPPVEKVWHRTECFKFNGKTGVYNFHYNGQQKPWRHSVSAKKIPASIDQNTPQKEFWFYWLGVANRTMGLEIPTKIEMDKLGNPYQYDKGKNPSVLLDPKVEIPYPKQLVPVDTSRRES